MEEKTIQCWAFAPHSLECLSMQHLKAVNFKSALVLFQLVDKYSIKCEAVASVPYLPWYDGSGIQTLFLHSDVWDGPWTDERSDILCP